MLEIVSIVNPGPWYWVVFSSPDPTVDVRESEAGFVDEGESDELPVGVLRLLRPPAQVLFLQEALLRWKRGHCNMINKISPHVSYRVTWLRPHSVFPLLNDDEVGVIIDTSSNGVDLTEDARHLHVPQY